MPCMLVVRVFHKCAAVAATLGSRSLVGCMILLVFKNFYLTDIHKSYTDKHVKVSSVGA